MALFGLFLDKVFIVLRGRQKCNKTFHLVLPQKCNEISKSVLITILTLIILL